MNIAPCPGLTVFRVAALLILLVAGVFSATGIAEAGQAALGQPVFYPCTSCHPVVGGQPSTKLPNGFKGHRIELEVHDKLGAGSAACLTCHEDPAKDPGKLKLLGGATVDITGDVSKVCYRCHSEKYKEWEAGAHGRNEAKCTSSGCHDPHTPSYIYAKELLPFVGTGFQARTVSERVAFTPLASAPAPAPVETPGWLIIATGLGAVLSAGLVGFITLGRRTR